MWTYDSRTYDDRNNLISFDAKLVSTESLLTEEENHFKKSDAYTQYKNYLTNGRALSAVFPKKMRNELKEAVYVYEDSNKNTYYTYAGNALNLLMSCLYITIIVQLLIIIGSIASGARKIRNSLSPLDELAFTAQVLSKSPSFDQNAIDELEEAINAISPSSEGARLNTGNSEMEELEKSINRLIDRMRDNYKRQSRFVSDASHELRTPISVLQGYANMLDRWGKDDERVLEESIEAIKSETDHMKMLVEQLLFLARGDSGKTQLKLEDFSLNNMLHEVYDESVMIDTNHVYIFSPSQEEITVKGDIAMLKQTVRILTDNAAKYTPSGSGITLRTFLSHEGSPAFSIQDEGIGITGDDASHMFERFYRADPARAKDSGGTGLGLAIAKWIIDRHGGHFDVVSRQDIGTRITVILP
ncbi:MAG: HAMP domain-containing histidine kinase [Clostridiales bacterium]|nr:HAMP domain-containing histidine kinase [Clostridiales bacterium]